MEPRNFQDLQNLQDSQNLQGYILPEFENQTLVNPMINSVGNTIFTDEGTGVARFTSIPSEADIYIDGDYYGTTPTTITNLPEGRHQYTLKKAGHYDYTRFVDVYAGKLCCTNIDLELMSRSRECSTEDVPKPSEPIGISRKDIAIMVLASLLGIVAGIAFEKK